MQLIPKRSPPMNLNRRHKELQKHAEELSNSIQASSEAINIILSNISAEQKDNIYFGGKGWKDQLHTPYTPFNFTDIRKPLMHLGRQYEDQFIFDKELVDTVLSAKHTTVYNQVIMLKDKKKKNELPVWIKIPDEKKAQSNLIHEYNDFMSGFNVSFNGRRLTTSLVRIYNNGSWLEGGRFYGSQYQGLSGVERKEVTIDGSQVVELDYANLHPSILYLWKTGTVPNTDLYTLDGFNRKRLKIVFNTALNCRDYMQAYWAIVQTFKNQYDAGEFWDDEKEPTDYLNILPKHYEQIREKFFTGVGLRLQGLDSRMAATIFHKFSESNKPILGVHDSFIVKAEDEQKLKTTMIEAYQETLNTEHVPEIK